MALKEFEILHILVRHRGELVTREQMLQEVWGYEKDNLPETRTVDNHIAKLRTKVGDTVEEGQVVAAVEAMKAKHDVRAPAAGRVISIDAQLGADVAAGQPIMTLGR